MNELTIRDAAEKWVASMNAIPTELINALVEQDPDSWVEVTKPEISDRVYLYEEGEEGIIQEYHPEESVYEIDLKDGRTVCAEENDFEIQQDSFLPMWGQMWSFSNLFDVKWLESDAGRGAMSEAGFRIYKSERFGYFFGIDGAGYNFYDAHWIPLYDARGLKWHSEKQVA